MHGRIPPGLAPSGLRWVQPAVALNDEKLLYAFSLPVQYVGARPYCQYHGAGRPILMAIRDDALIAMVFPTRQVSQYKLGSDDPTEPVAFMQTDWRQSVKAPA
jgi:hypothetical protein